MPDRRGIAQRLLHFEERTSARADADLMDAIQRLALAHRHYGYRRITAQLRREGWIANAKRVLSLRRCRETSTAT